MFEYDLQNQLNKDSKTLVVVVFIDCNVYVDK